MSPLPCAHCAMNFMRTNLDPDAPKLCNNCIVREELRNPKKGEPMETVEILIKCPKKIHAQIEEFCIARGKDYSKYFLNLHEEFAKTLVEETKEEVLEESISKKKGKR